MIPVAVVVAAIAAVAPWVSRENRARYAADIASVSPNLETAHALVATASVESDFRPTIERCECPDGECDRDKDGRMTAHGLYQLHAYNFGGHTAEEICSSNRLATQLAARMLLGLAARRGGMREALRIYIGAEVRRDDPRFKKRLDMFDALEDVHPDV